MYVLSTIILIAISGALLAAILLHALPEAIKESARDAMQWCIVVGLYLLTLILHLLWGILR